MGPAPKVCKNVDKKKSGVKTNKFASVIFVGVLFFILLFGGLVPSLKVRYGGMREPFTRGDSFVSGTGYSRKYSGKDHSSLCDWGGQGESNQQNNNKVAKEFTWAMIVILW